MPSIDFKGQCVLVPTDLKKIQRSSSCDKECLIPLALKCQLTDKSVINMQEIHPVLFNTTPQKLAKINSFYSNITINNEWKNLSEQSHLLLWRTLLTNKNAGEYNTRDQTDGDDDTESND